MYGFKRKINWNKCLAETADQVKNRFLDFLIDPSFQGLNRLFVLSFKDDDSQENHEQYHLSTMEIKDLKKNCELIAIDLNKQQKLDVDPKAIQQINFTANLDRAWGNTKFFIIEEAKETVLYYCKRTVKVSWFYFTLT